MPWSSYLADKMGSVVLTPEGPFEAGSYVSLTLSYVAGALGIDDTGGIKISFRTTSDMGKPQFTNPAAAGYTTAEASNGAGLECLFDRINIRPWTHTLYVRAMKGFLRPNERITVRIGDARFGGPGIRMQTNAEREFPLKVFVDAVATYEFVEIPNSPAITLLPGQPNAWLARLPTLRRPNQPFRLRNHAARPVGQRDRSIRRRAQARPLSADPGASRPDCPSQGTVRRDDRRPQRA